MSYSEDHIVLAAEYVLGTLGKEEREQVDRMMAVDPDYRQMVERWERHLGELNVMVGSADPPDALWEKVRSAAFAAGQPGTQAALPDLPPALPAPANDGTPATGPEATARIVRLNARAKTWRNITAIMTGLAACLAAIVVTQVNAPNLVPASLRPKPEVRVVEAAPPPAAPAQPAAIPQQFVALLQRGSDLPAFILTVDTGTRAYSVRRVGAQPEKGKSFELWLVSDKLPKPRSLGVIGRSDFTIIPSVAASDPSTMNTATYAVSVEPEGGSPTGTATGPIVFTGKLVETVPQLPPGALSPPK